MIERLTDDEVTTALSALDGWQLREGRLRRVYEFSDFTEAIGFMMRSAIWAERLNHHPEWSNVYRTVEVELVTHDVNGISRLDVELADKMNELAEGRRRLP